MAEPTYLYSSYKRHLAGAQSGEHYGLSLCGASHKTEARMLLDHERWAATGDFRTERSRLAPLCIACQRVAS